MADGIFVNTITEIDSGSGGTPITTTYNIEAQRMSQGTVGSSKNPVYFLDGVPTACSGSTGGGGGSDVIITPDRTINQMSRSQKTTIATFKIDDGDTQEICIPRVSSGYQKQVLFTGVLNEATGEGGGAALDAPFINFDFLYIYIEDNKNMVGTKVIIVPTNSLYEKVKAGKGIVSCELYGTLGMALRFTSPTGVKVEYINNLPNYDSSESTDEYLSVYCSKIEGVTLGISQGSWGANTKDLFWTGEESTVNPTEFFPYLEERELDQYDMVCVYGHVENEDEEYINLGAVDSLKSKMDNDKSTLTCGDSFRDVTKTLLFKNNGFYIIGASESEEELNYVITRIDCIKYGAEVKDTSDCMKKKIDYVTAGWNDYKQDYSYIDRGEGSTIEGMYNITQGDASHAEGGHCVAISTPHGVGYDTDFYASHAEGNGTTAYGGAHAEGSETYARGLGAHAEGCNTTIHNSLKNNEISTDGSHVEGGYNMALGSYHHAEGNGCLVSSFCDSTYYDVLHDNDKPTKSEWRSSHVEGENCRAYNVSPVEYCDRHGIKSLGSTIGSSHAEGQSCKAHGGSHAEGFESVAFGGQISSSRRQSSVGSIYKQPVGHAEGKQTETIGGHSEGLQTYSIEHAHAGGRWTSSLNRGCYTIGQCNIPMKNLNLEDSFNEISYSWEGFDTVGQIYSNGPICAKGKSFVIGNGVPYYTDEEKKRDDTGGAAEWEIVNEYPQISSNAFSVDFDGNFFYMGAANTPNSGYAEYFKWDDDNPNGEDRVGYFVTLNGKAIRKATSEDKYILGVTCYNPAVAGRSDCDIWDEYFEKDSLNRMKYDHHEQYVLCSYKDELDRTYYTTELITDKDGKPIYSDVPKIDYRYVNRDITKFVPKKDDKAYAAVGLVGVVAVYDDGLCEVGSYCQPSGSGTATYYAGYYDKTKNLYRVVERVSQDVIKIVLK